MELPRIGDLKIAWTFYELQFNLTNFIVSFVLHNEPLELVRIYTASHYPTFGFGSASSEVRQCNSIFLTLRKLLEWHAIFS
jgi:hypothetical protein